MCLHIHLPVFVDNLYGRQQVASVIHAVQSSAGVDHACEHVNIPEYTEHFRAYTDLRNQGVTNVG